MTTSQDELNQEVELKLQLLNGMAGESLWKNLYVKNGLMRTPEEKNLRSVYYDTSDHRLLKQGYTLRVRKDNRSHTLTIKKMGNVAGGLHQRAEWNYPSPSEKPSVDVVEDQDLQECLNKILGEQTLEELMITDFRRTQSNWQDEDGNLLEVALDEGFIETKKGKENIREVEMELKRGQAIALLMMGEQLAASMPMIPGNESKFFRGLQMLNIDNEKVASKDKNDFNQLLIKDNSLETVLPSLLQEVFYQVLACYGRLCQQEILGEDVHQIRVSIRQLRSLLLLFKPALTKASYTPLVRKLQSLAKDFEMLREVQVVQYHFHQSPCTGTCGQLEEIINEELSKELQIMNKIIKRGKLTPLLLRLWRMVMTVKVKESYRDQSVSRFTEEKLVVWLKEYHLSHVKLSSMDMKNLHRQRIRVKRIRYAAAWLRPVLPKKVLKNIKTLKEQQELMGELHDIHCEKIKLREWIAQRQSSVDIMYQLGLYEGWQEKQKHNLWEGLLN